MLTLKVPRLFSSGQSWGTHGSTEQSKGTGWVGLGAGPSPPDPRVAPTYLALCLRACSDQPALRGHKKDEMGMRQSMEGQGGGEGTLRPGAWEVREGPSA